MELLSTVFPNYEVDSSSSASDVNSAPVISPVRRSERPRRAPQKLSDWAWPGPEVASIPAVYVIRPEDPFRDLDLDYASDEDIFNPIPSPVKCKKCKNRQKKRPRTRLQTEW